MDSKPPNLAGTNKWNAGEAKPASNDWSDAIESISNFLKQQSANMRPPTMEEMSFGAEGSEIMSRNKQRGENYAPQKKKAWAAALGAGLIVGGPMGMAVAGVAHFLSGGWLGRAVAQTLLSATAASLRLVNGKTEEEATEATATTVSSISVPSKPTFEATKPPRPDPPSDKAALAEETSRAPGPILPVRPERLPASNGEAESAKKKKSDDYAGNADYSKDIPKSLGKPKSHIDIPRVDVYRGLVLPPGQTEPMPIEKIKSKLTKFPTPEEWNATRPKEAVPIRPKRSLGMDI